ncbi:hypothetical protein [Rhodoferax sp. OV413]|uniref:hypothetical protein n=1 Tax=Rhodoferax sp. OV413 TaxID=1855285 RepID=UPI0025CB97D0|nr:hypothetical protein [Rhodoferax sp. OV413]
MTNRKNFHITIFSIIFFFSLHQIALAEIQVQVSIDDQAIISDDGLGVEVRIDRNGKLLSIKSTHQHPVEFQDRRGINKAYIIAEEKAKANIARFMSQAVSTSRITTELDSITSLSNRNRSSGGEIWTKDNSRKVVESILEVTTSQASAILMGVRVIERSYNDKNEEATVVVGINGDSAQAAQQLQKGLINQDNSDKKKSTSKNNFPSIEAEKKRSSDFNNF